MTKNSLLIILGNQLFPIKYIKETSCKDIFMSEDFGLCKEYKHHKLKILMFFIAMRNFKKELIKKGYKVHYHSIEDKDFKESIEKKISKVIKNNNINKINQFELADNFLKNKIKQIAKTENILFETHKSPMFILSKSEFREYASQRNNFLQANFYKFMRKKLNLLLDNNLKPTGGKWSYDEDNRKKITKNICVPPIPKVIQHKDISNIKSNILKYFSDHPGDINNIWFPTNRKGALIWLDNFFKNKFKNFGSFEDAIQENNNFLFHSNISPLMNMGIITPAEVVNRACEFYKNNNIPLNSFEGFIRQIIGWREFIKGIYDIKGNQQINSNFWNHSNKLTKDWYEGTTGIKPLDDTIQDCIKYGYTHHIPRLMILANIMTLSRIHPYEIYKWFMEMFIDSSEWVMIPNIYGMGTFSDGGIFSTKPYICGSNYLLKMSNYKKGDWCEILDGLYWKFINDNIDYFKSNPRLSIMKNALNKIGTDRRNIIFDKANDFIKNKTISENI